MATCPHALVCPHYRKGCDDCQPTRLAKLEWVAETAGRVVSWFDKIEEAPPICWDDLRKALASLDQPG